MFDALIVQPLITSLAWLESLVGSFGLAIILLTVIVKLITLPLTAQQLRASKEMQQLQPKVQALQKKYKNDRDKLTQQTMALYREHGVNPLAGCLPLIIQMPVWIGLYRALLVMAQDGLLDSSFLWLPSLAQPQGMPPLAVESWPYFILPVLTVVSQYVVQKMTTPPSMDPQASLMAQMMMIMPLMFGVFALQVPSGLSLYWVTTNVFTLIQQGFTTGWDSLKFWEPARAREPAQGAQSGPAPVGGGSASGRRKRKKR